MGKACLAWMACACAVLGCGKGSVGPAGAARAENSLPLPGAAVELAGTAPSGHFAVKLRFAVPRVGEMFAVTADVADAKGAPLPAEASVTLDATMPAHGHGMMTQPLTRALGQGRFAGEGFKLHMAGAWRFEATIHAGAAHERVDLPFVQPPEAASP